MTGPFANRTYRHLFAAQIVALMGTGLATVALGLLAWDLAGEDAGQVLGTALAIKMLAYVGLAPLTQAAAAHLPRRALLVSLDLIRAAVALSLPFVTEIWHIYGLIFLLQAASAGFTPAYQATLPDLLSEEEDYTKALSYSRLAYDLESLLSPMLAAALLTVVSFPSLFLGTVTGFLASAALILSARLPARPAAPPRPFAERLTRGLRIYLATPRLRGLLALSLAIAAASAMVIVNSVVLVQGRFGLGQGAVALTLGLYGGGSMLAALLLPRLLRSVPDRPVMLIGAGILALGTALIPACQSHGALLMLWALLGLGVSLTLTPSGRLLRRSAHAEDRPALFAAQFALSHGCFLLTYPLAGWIGARAGLDAAALALAALAALGTGLALRLWPADSQAALPHSHPDLPPDHPHLRGDRGAHRHPVVIDDLHGRWPSGV